MFILARVQASRLLLWYIWWQNNPSCLPALGLSDSLQHSMYVHAQSLRSCLTLGNPMAPLSMEFPRQEYWSRLPCPPPGDLPNPGLEPTSPTLQTDSLPSEPPGKPFNEMNYVWKCLESGRQNTVDISLFIQKWSGFALRSMSMAWMPVSFLGQTLDHHTMRMRMRMTVSQLLQIRIWHLMVFWLLIPTLFFLFKQF